MVSPPQIWQVRLIADQPMSATKTPMPIEAREGPLPQPGDRERTTDAVRGDVVSACPRPLDQGESRKGPTQDRACARSAGRHRPLDTSVEMS